MWTTSNLCFSTKRLKRAPCVPYTHSFPWYVLIWLRKRFQLQLFMNYLLLNMDSADKSASSIQKRLVMNMDSTEDISGVERSSLTTNKSSFSIDCLLGKTISSGWWKSDSTKTSSTNLEFRIQEFFKRIFINCSTAEKNSWKKFVKISDEFVIRHCANCFQTQLEIK